MATKIRAPYSFDEVRELVRDAVRANQNDAGTTAYVYDLWGDASGGEAVYWLESTDAARSSAYVQVDYQITDGAAVLTNATPVRRSVTYVPVKMSTSFSADFRARAKREGANTVAVAHVFTLGEYPDKKFSLTADEFDEVVLPSFRPVPILFEHGATVLTDGDEFNAGALRRIWREGDAIFGELSVRQWVVDALGEGATPAVSISFDRTSKHVIELSLVRQPRVAEAAVVTAFNDDGGARKGSPMEWLRSLLFARQQMPESARAEFDAALAGSSPVPAVQPAAPTSTAPAAAFNADHVAKLSTSCAAFARAASGRVPAEQVDRATAVYAALLGSATFNGDALVEPDHARNYRELIESLPQFGSQLTTETIGAVLQPEGVQKPAATAIDASAIYAAFNAKEGK